MSSVHATTTSTTSSEKNKKRGLEDTSSGVSSNRTSSVTPSASSEPEKPTGSATKKQKANTSTIKEKEPIKETQQTTQASQTITLSRYISDSKIRFQEFTKANLEDLKDFFNNHSFKATTSLDSIRGLDIEKIRLILRGDKDIVGLIILQDNVMLFTRGIDIEALNHFNLKPIDNEGRFIDVGSLSIIIDANKRKFGYGKTACQQMVKEIKEVYKDLSVLLWYAKSDNTASINLAKSCGFEQAETKNLGHTLFAKKIK